MTKIVVCTPAFGDQIHARVARQILALQERCQKEDIGFDWFVLTETYLQVARDVLARTFLESDGTHLFFVDTDNIVTADGMMKLLEHDKDVVAGIYPTKEIQWKNIHTLAKHLPWHMLPHVQAKSLIFRPEDAKDTEFPDAKELLAVRGAPTGMMMIKRELLEAFPVHYPKEKYVHQNYGELTRYFAVEFIDGTFFGEDMWFCHKVNQMGRQVYIDPMVNIGHIGLNIFYGCAWCASGNVIHKTKDPNAKAFQMST